MHFQGSKPLPSTWTERQLWQGKPALQGCFPNVLMMKCTVSFVDINILHLGQKSVSDSLAGSQRTLERLTRTLRNRCLSGFSSGKVSSFSLRMLPNPVYTEYLNLSAPEKQKNKQKKQRVSQQEDELVGWEERRQHIAFPLNHAVRGLCAYMVTMEIS